MSHSSSNTRYQTSLNSIEDIHMSSSSLAEGVRQAYDFLVQSNEQFFFDPKPQIIYKQSAEDPIVYQQKVLLRYLQPPPVPEPGPLIIREVRAPQPPPPRPLIVRQYANPLPSLPPLILREKPPVRPAPVPSQTIIRQLPPSRPPPRSVVIESVPSPPKKPRDILIERWLPYSSSNLKRKIIVEKAPPAAQYPVPRNTIFVYDPPRTQIVHNVERLGIVHENPEKYANRYGTTLLDPNKLIEQVRAAGVTEDITPPSLDSISTSSLYKGKKSSIPFDMISTASSQGFLVSNFAADRTDNSIESLSSRKKLKKSN